MIKEVKMENKKVLWLEDQAEGLRAYRSSLFRAGFLVDNAKSVSGAVEKLSNADYAAIIFDIKVLPGEDEMWIALDKQKREENPEFDPSLGLELLYSLFKPYEAEIKLEPAIEIDPRRIIVLSVVHDKIEELKSMGIPEEQIIYKSDWDFSTLPRLIKEIQEKDL